MALYFGGQILKRKVRRGKVDKYLTSNNVSEMFHITKRTLNRWEINTPWGIPFPAPALSSEGGTMKRYLATDVMKWEEECQQKKQLKKAI